MTTSVSPTAPLRQRNISHATSARPATLVPIRPVLRSKAVEKAIGEPIVTTDAMQLANTHRGVEGVSELEDYDYNMSKTRRRTNSSTAAAGHSIFKTKFEAIDPEVIEYEEDLHGPSPTDMADQGELEKMSTSSSADTMGSSVEEEDAAEKK